MEWVFWSQGKIASRWCCVRDSPFVLFCREIFGREGKTRQFRSLSLAFDWSLFSIHENCGMTLAWKIPRKVKFEWKFCEREKFTCYFSVFTTHKGDPSRSVNTNWSIDWWVKNMRERMKKIVMRDEQIFRFFLLFFLSTSPSPMQSVGTTGVLAPLYSRSRKNKQDRNDRTKSYNPFVIPRRKMTVKKWVKSDIKLLFCSRFRWRWCRLSD